MNWKHELLIEQAVADVLAGLLKVLPAGFEPIILCYIQRPCHKHVILLCLIKAQLTGAEYEHLSKWKRIDWNLMKMIRKTSHYDYYIIFSALFACIQLS